jgi:hypothetical protein
VVDHAIVIIVESTLSNQIQEREKEHQEGERRRRKKRKKKKEERKEKDLFGWRRTLRHDDWRDWLIESSNGADEEDKGEGEGMGWVMRVK